MTHFLPDDNLLETILNPEKYDDETDDFDRLEALEHEMDRLPEIASKIASFEDFIDNPPPVPSWHIELYFFLVPLPSRHDSFALLVLDWDDNWGRWEWSVGGAVEAAESKDKAAEVLMQNFAARTISDGNTEFERFLGRYIEAND